MCMIELATNTMMDERMIGSQSAVRGTILSLLRAKCKTRITDARLHFSGSVVKQTAGRRSEQKSESDHSPQSKTHLGHSQSLRQICTSGQFCTTLPSVSL